MSTLHLRATNCIFAFAVLSGTSSGAAGQQSGATGTQTSDVVRAADDAFGRRVGVEQIGLYSESNVRGFSLEDAGNYRIEGAYFVRAAAPANAIVTGTATRVGVNALRYDLPAPSGVVDYDLRRPEPGSRLAVETGTRANSGPFAEFFVDHAPQGSNLALSAGLQLYPWQKYSDGARGNFVSAGAVARWGRDAGPKLTAFATATRWHYDADTGYAVTDAFLPPRIERRDYRGQDWTRVRNRTRVGGLIAEAPLPSGWQARASLFHAVSQDETSDFNLYRVLDPGGAAEALAFAVPEQSSRATSAEVAAVRQWRRGSTGHRLFLAARARDGRARSSAGTVLNLGRTSLFDSLLESSRPDSGSPEREEDQVRQWTAAAGYRLSIGDSVEVRADVQRTRYRKKVTAADGTQTANTTSPWLYSGSATIGLNDKLSAFASYTRGLEESGTAPDNAVNRNAVLPAVLATQAEVGVRYAVTERLSVVGGLFQIDKPVPGLTADGRFELVGRARHRGAELSLAGSVTDTLTIVAGATYLDAAIRDASGTRRQAPGRPEWLAQLNATWRIAAVPGLSLDGSLTYTGREVVNREASLRTRPFTEINAGLRYRFTATRLPVTVRARVTNLFNTFAWTATPSELLFYNRPRSFALSLGTEL